jgi:uncharacterized protein (DUF1810 family)
MGINSLDRFVEAQKKDYEIALREITEGKKSSHWMWYIFPQLRGLGESNTSYIYGISGPAEARAYLAHPLLAENLLKICTALLEHKDKNAYVIFGSEDGNKLRSSMTLFAAISEEGSVFHKVLDQFFGGEPDKNTIDILLKMTDSKSIDFIEEM